LKIELREMIEGLNEQEAKSLLFNLLLHLDMLEESNDDVRGIVSTFQKACEELHRIRNGKHQEKEDVVVVHIVFSDSTRGGLICALKEMGKYEHEEIISFPHNFSIGLITQLEKDSGLARRNEWIETHLNIEDEEIEEGLKRFKKAVLAIDSIPAHVPIIIWTGNNAHEQTGIRFVLNLLKEKLNEVFCINATTLYEQLYGKKGIDYCLLHTGEVSPKQLRGMYEKIDDTCLLSSTERKKFEEEWKELSQTDEVLRIWENGKIHSVLEHFHDEYILSELQAIHKGQLEKDYVKAARVIGSVIGHLEQYHGDVFFEYRLRSLIMNGTIDIHGVPKGMRYYSVKAK
jgi:Protein of unknown function/Domain of unknown function (DUF1835)